MILSLAIEIADALDALHAGGNIHQDVKPANINFAVPFKIIFSDQFGNEFRANGILRRKASLKGATPTWGGEGAIRPRPDLQAAELSVGDDARRRYLHLLALEKLVKQQRVQR